MKLWPFLKSKMKNHTMQEVSDGEKTLSYEKLMAFADHFSKKLKGYKCCAIICRSELSAGIALLSCFAAEVTAVPLSQRYGDLHCQKILDTISPDVVITDADDDLQIVSMEECLYESPKTHQTLIMCTSGTTGAPKGIMLSDSNIITNISDITSYFGVNSTDTILISRPLYHCAVLTGEFLTALVKGAKIRFYSGVFNPAIILKMIDDYKITALCGTPTLLSLMSRSKRITNTNCLRHICISGECMSLEIGKVIASAFPNADIYHLYGLTEACPRVAYLPPILFNEYADCVGIPLGSVSLKILSLSGELVKNNEIGMLWVKGDNVMIGYYNDPKKTSEVMKDGWLCTGDLATFNDKGLLMIKGRADDLIIKAGMNIYPQEIESALKADPRVHELYVYGENNLNGVQIVLDIAGDFSDISEIRELCIASLPSYQIPTKINWMKELPKNGSGKIMRRCNYV